MNLNDIDYLTTVAEHRHIGRAAEALGLTQPALTRAIARLEALAGLQLFERHAKGVALTPAGEAFLRRAQRIRMEYDDALREMHQIKSGELGIMRVGYSPAVDDRQLMTVMQRMLLERPAVRIHLVQKLTGDLQAMLLGGELDIAIGQVHLSPHPEIFTQPLFHDTLHVVAELSHPLHRLERLGIADIVSQAWLLPGRNVALRQSLTQLAREAGFADLNVRVETASLSRRYAQLLVGTGMLSVGSTWTLGYLKQLNIAPLRINLPIQKRNIGLLARRGAYRSPLVERFCELMLNEAPAPG